MSEAQVQLGFDVSIEAGGNSQDEQGIIMVSFDPSKGEDRGTLFERALRGALEHALVCYEKRPGSPGCDAIDAVTVHIREGDAEGVTF